MKIRHILIYIIIGLVCSVSVEAKGAPDNVQPSQNMLEGVDQQLRTKINFARQLMTDRNYEGASAYLEALYEKHPDNPVIINLLKQCYGQLQLYLKMETLIRRQIDKDPDNINYWTSLAEVTAQQGNIDDALKYYDKAESLIEGENNVRFQILIQSMLSQDLDVQAQKKIEQWRIKYDEPELLAAQMGQIYEQQKLYANAIKEYYPLLFDTTRAGNDIERYVMNLLMFEDSAPPVEQYLLQQKDLFSNERAVKILSTYYLRTNKLENAFEFTVHRDSLEHLNGNALIQYMQNCNNRKLYSETIRMGDYLTATFKQPVVTIRGQFLYAEALIALREYDKAIATYNDIFATASNNRDKTDALYNLGKLYRERLHDVDKALVYYDSVATHFKYGMSYLNTLVEIPYCYLQLGNLKDAQTHYTQLEQRRLNDEIKEKVDYYLALIEFLNKQVDSSRVALSKLMIDFPKGFYVNDALELMMVIDEGKDTPAVLYEYAGALLFELENKPDSVIKRLDKIAGDDSKVLADFALYKLYQETLAQGDTARTITYIDRLKESFPESYYLPFGLKQKADIYLGENNKADEAKAIYLHLLETYPNYPFISEVRKTLREITDKQDSA